MLAKSLALVGWLRFSRTLFLVFLRDTPGGHVVHRSNASVQGSADPWLWVGPRCAAGLRSEPQGVAYYEGWETAQGTALTPCNQARPMEAVGCPTVD